MPQKDRICIVPMCGQPCFSRERCQACLRYYRRNHYDAPLEVIEKRQQRGAGRLDEAAIAREIVSRLAR